MGMASGKGSAKQVEKLSNRQSGFGGLFYRIESKSLAQPKSAVYLARVRIRIQFCTFVVMKPSGRERIIKY